MVINAQFLEAVIISLATSFKLLFDEFSVVVQVVKIKKHKIKSSLITFNLIIYK
jgi:hypothetical protein